MKDKKAVQRIAVLSMLLALALIFGWIEHLVPIAVPGVKLGLANITVLFALYALDMRSAFVLSCAKVVLSSMLFGGISGLLYSAAGALISFAVMAAAKYGTDKLSAVGVSALGGAAHVAAQLFVAALITEQLALWRMLAPLLVAGTVSGVLTGLVTVMVMQRLGGIIKVIYNRKESMESGDE